MRPQLLAAAALCGLAAGALAAPLDEAHLYSPQATWQDSLRTSLGNVSALEDQEREAAVATSGSVAKLGPWYMIGTFSNAGGKGFATAYPAEKEIALDRSYPGLGGDVRWRRMDAFRDGQVINLLPYFKETEWAITYLYRTITATAPTTLQASFGSDDGLAVWLNGEQLISEDVPRGAAPDQDLATLPLHAGENHLLLKIVNRTGGYAYYFAAKEQPYILGPWYAIGAFDNADGKGFAFPYPPEKEIALDKAYPGAEGKPVKWRRFPEGVDGQVIMINGLFTPNDWALVYLYRNIIAPRPVEITGYFGSDDGLAVWLNGEKLISEDVPRGPAPDQDTARLKLRAGENHLLLKIVNRTGGWGYYFSTQPGGGKPQENPTHLRRIRMVWDQVRANFAGPEDQRQMKQETADGIWPADWSPTDETTLLARYRDSLGAHLDAAAQALANLQQDLGAAKVAAPRQQLLALQKARDAQSALPADTERGTTVSGVQENPSEHDRDGHATSERLAPMRGLYHRGVRLGEALAVMARVVSARLAVDDLAASYPGKYTRGPQFKQELAQLGERAAKLASAELSEYGELTQLGAAVISLQRRALVEENPLLDFGRLLFISRKPGEGAPGLPQNWQGNCSIARTGYDTSICTLSPVRGDGQVRSIFHSDSAFVGDLCLHWDGKRMLFSMPAATKGNSWQVWEIGADGGRLRMVTESAEPDYDNYCACYLPGGKMQFMSSRCYQAVPCTGGDHVALLYLMDADGGNVRQLTYDQDHSWYPTVMNDGRVIYTRWEYNDLPHYFARILFTMNPDGTRQTAFYGSNSYFPNTPIYAKPIPGSNTRVVCIVSGHHGNPRMGEIAIVDSSQGEREVDGVVQILPERHRKPEPVIVDQYATGKWPQFVHPYPLSDKYFLVSCKPGPDDWWGLYLVDVFDNLVPIRVEPGAALMEPIPLRPRLTPPVIPDAVNLARRDATVYLFDVYRGRGMEGVPRGTVKRLRLIEPTYRYWGNGETHTAAIDGGWDVKRILGTVPVNPDGSAFFRVPANTPIAVQPINAEGMAQQVMRSWFTAMPGENVSCVGCHENRRDTLTSGMRSSAQNLRALDITPWYGPARGFSFEREVQPVLSRACIGCHDGQHAGRPDFRPKGAPGQAEVRFSVAYQNLHPFVRRPGLEADIRLLPPREFEANTSQLVQMLKKGHFGVKLTAEDWDRLITWIDMNVPYAGDWREAYPPAPEDLIRRREEIRQQDAAHRAQVASRGK